MSARLALALLALAAAFAALVAVLVPNPGTNAARPAPAPVAAVPAAHAVHADGTAVSSTIDETSADEAFLADLFDGQATEVSAQQRADLVAIGHRICDLRQPRAEWLAALTAPGPHAYTADEAGKILDTAEAAYCPQVLAEAYPAPAATPAPVVVSAPRTPAAPAPAATPTTPTASPSATPVEEQATPTEATQQQLPEEAIGGARCGDSDRVVTSIDADGTPIC